MKKDFLLISGYFLTWRVLLFLISFLATKIIPIWGGRFPYADSSLVPTGLPSWIWSFGNFDGAHYLRIAQNGYLDANSQAFFPLYPILISMFNIFPRDLFLDLRFFVDPSYFYSGIILSNLFFVFGLMFLYRLLKLDYSTNISKRTIFLLLLFPTAFYFGAIYTESLFFLTVVASIYYMRKENFFLAGLLAMAASATRVLGVFLFPVLLIEFYKSGLFKKYNSLTDFLNWFGTLLAPLGLIFYMFYLKLTFSNPLYFLSVQPSFGAARSAVPTVLLPQVIYRYLKIFVNVPIASLSFLNAGLEFLFTLIPLIFLIFLFKKMRLSYWVFTLGVLIIPTLTGTFLSMPRFALMAFLVLPFVANSKFYKLIIFTFVILSIILISLFTRGYWVA